MAYNVEYINNKTKNIQREVHEVLDKVNGPRLPLVDAAFTPMLDVVDSIFACIGLDASSASVCPLGVSAYGLYESARTQLNSNLRALKYQFSVIIDLFNQFESAVAIANVAADGFYNSINGASGIIKWIIKNSQGLFSSNSFCGKGNPNYCSFSMVVLYFCQY
jgi:hypothetical protein